MALQLLHDLFREFIVSKSVDRPIAADTLFPKGVLQLRFDYVGIVYMVKAHIDSICQGPNFFALMRIPYQGGHIAIG